MPTSKPRITITLNNRQHELLEAMSKVQKVSMSSIVVDLLDTAMPVLERVLEMLDAASKAPKAALDELKRSLDVAEGEVMSLQAAALGQLDLLIAEVGGEPAVSEHKDEHAKRLQKEKPPSTNRGVRKTPNSQKSPMKTRAKTKSIRGEKK